MKKEIKATLYLVPTPIGNLSDMTFRAVQVLKDVDIVYAEDTRTSSVLLQHYDIATPVRSYHKFNESSRCPEIIELLKAGKSIAIISDAGTPGISDPSNIIIRESIKHSVPICPLPGATALIPALCASGFDTSQFYMAGFLPTQKKQTDALLNRLKSIDVPIVFYEAPHRLHKTLLQIQQFFGNADTSISREISKIYESFYRGKLSDILVDIESITLKGEFVIVTIPEKKEINIEESVLRLYQEKYSDEKLSKASINIAQELNIAKNVVYEILIKKNK